MITLPMSDLGICTILQNNIDKIEIGYYRMDNKMLVKCDRNINIFNNVDDLFTYKKIADYIKNGYKVIYFSIGMRCFSDIVNYSKVMQEINNKYNNLKNNFYNEYPIENMEYLKFFDDIKYLYEN